MEETDIHNEENIEIEEDNEFGNYNKKENKKIHNIQSILNLKKYEQSIFHYFMVLKKNNNYPEVIKLVFIIIETIQLFSLFYNYNYFKYLPKSISSVSYIFLLRIFSPTVTLTVTLAAIVIVYLLFIIHFVLGFSSMKFPNILLKINAIFLDLMQSVFHFPILFSLLDFFDCSKVPNVPYAKYICFSQDHLITFVISLVLLFLYLSFSYLVSFYGQSYIPLMKNNKLSVYSNTTILTYRRIVLLEIANLFIFQIYFNLQIISSIILFVGFAYLLFIHLNNQNYYNKNMNCFYSAAWFSFALSSFVYIFFSIFRIKTIYFIFMIINIVGFVIGWFLNIFYSNWYINKIYSNIETKYNQQHVISKLKEQIEIEHIPDDEERSIETIVTEKRVIKKEKVYIRPSDCAYVSKFIMKNRSLQGFGLVHSLFKEGVFQYERIPEIYLQYWYFLHGIRRFIAVNRICFDKEDTEELLNKINYVSEKALNKCANLSRSLILKFLVYNATFIYEIDRSLTVKFENSQDKNCLTRASKSFSFL